MRRRQMAREKENRIKIRRAEFGKKLRRANSVVDFRRELASVRSREIAKQSLRKQQFFDVMEKLGKSHTGFERLMNLGFDLDNPNPKELNIENIMKQLNINDSDTETEERELSRSYVREERRTEEEGKYKILKLEEE